MSRFLFGVALGLVGCLGCSIGRFLKRVPAKNGVSREIYSPGYFVYAGYGLIAFGAIAMGLRSFIAIFAFLGFFIGLSFVLQFIWLRIARLRRNPELVRTPQAGMAVESRPAIANTREPIDLEDLRRQFQGATYAALIKHHLKRQNVRNRQAGFLDTVQLLPPKARPLVEGFIDRWNLRAYDKQFWQSDCATVFDAIINDAAEILTAEGAEIDDETLFNMFQIVTLSFAYSASKEPKMREFMGI